VDARVLRIPIWEVFSNIANTIRGRYELGLLRLGPGARSLTGVGASPGFRLARSGDLERATCSRYFSQSENEGRVI
jgi:hypothetical protein